MRAAWHSLPLSTIIFHSRKQRGQEILHRGHKHEDASHVGTGAVTSAVAMIGCTSGVGEGGTVQAVAEVAAEVAAAASLEIAQDHPRVSVQG